MKESVAKPNDDSLIKPAELREFLETQDDFAFELALYSQCIGLGLSATHAGTYIDPLTKKLRQYDVRAYAERGEYRINLAIECKAISPHYPLLISHVPRPHDDSYHDIISTDNVPVNILGGHARTKSVGAHLYVPGEMVGKAIRQVRRDKNGKLESGDQIFDKWMQAIASSDEIIESEIRRLDPRHASVRSSCVLPILVVSDDALWAAYYSATGKLQSEPMPINESTYFIARESRHDFRQYKVSHLHIFTRQGVQSFLASIARDDDIWNRIFA